MYLRYNITSHSLNDCNHFCSWHPIKRLAKTGHNDDPIAIPSIWLWNLPSNVTCVPEVANWKSFFRSALDISKSWIFYIDKQPSNSIYVTYYKLPYIGNFSTEVEQKIINYYKYYCKSANINIVFSSFKIGDLFSV